jgi:putative transcriptional regulator
MPAKTKKTKAMTSRSTNELLETARDMRASGLLTEAAHIRIMMRQVGIAPGCPESEMGRLEQSRGFGRIG